MCNDEIDHGLPILETFERRQTSHAVHEGVGYASGIHDV